MRCDYKLKNKTSQVLAWGITVEMKQKDLNTVFVAKFPAKNDQKQLLKMYKKWYDYIIKK